ncbi:MAG: hypothetical protein P1U49_04700 [Minwuia sp.]|nr:hypothetical protein [Minwuia sp.]
MIKAASRLLAVAILGMTTTACVGISKGNPLSLVPASELALIKNSAPKNGKKISVEDMLANARASDGTGDKTAPTVSNLELAWAGDSTEPEPGHLISLGNFVAAAPKANVTISCSSSLDAEGLRAHRRALAVRQVLNVLGVPTQVKRDVDVPTGALRLVRGGRAT